MLINALSNWIQRKVICPHFCPHAPRPEIAIDPGGCTVEVDGTTIDEGSFSESLPVSHPRFLPRRSLVG